MKSNFLLLDILGLNIFEFLTVIVIMKKIEYDSNVKIICQICVDMIIWKQPSTLL